MALTPGDRLGPYEVVAAIGAGGMGEVYRARDMRLERTVAIKILPAAMAADPAFRERFDREARAVAALNHPHICTLYDIGEDAGTAFLVMEYLEGETLADRLTKGALPIDQALRYAIQIAEALDKAHRAGIVHRDLKPGNIMLTKSGAKLLDFGLAKSGGRGQGAAGGLAAGSLLSFAPTAHSPVTAQGTILGTLQYMAPEQVEGREADARSDIFAFGAIVYEMVTGKRAFEGKSQASVIAAILDREPPAMSSLQPLAPAMLDHIVQRCLAKNPEDRWQSAGDAMRELAWIASTTATSSVPIVTLGMSNRRKVLLIALGAIALVVGFTGGLAYTARSAPERPLVRFAVSAPPGATLATATRTTIAVISPDGKRLAFVAGRGGTNTLWVRPIDSLDARPLTGTEGAYYPFWSPDSRSLGFFAVNRLKIVDVDGGQVQTLCDVVTGAGGSWSSRGTIVFAGTATGGLMQIPAVGGTPTEATRVTSTPGEVAHRFPSFLPDGTRYLFYSVPSNTIWIASLDGAETKKLINADASAIYAPEGYVLYGRQNALFAQSFDPRSMTLSGRPVSIAQQLARDGNGYTAASASATGTLVFRTGAAATRTQLTWLSRNGQTTSRVGAPGLFRNPSLSPDGTRVAVEVADPQGRNQDIWLGEANSGTLSRLTFDPHNDIYAVWSPDGKRIVFGSDRDGVFNIFEKPTNGAGPERQIAKSTDDMSPYSLSNDGRLLFFRLNVSNTGVLSLTGDPMPKPLLQAGFTQNLAQVSPDGRWVAYQSNESGTYEVYIRSFPDINGKWQVSNGGGGYVRWRADGRELYYYTPGEHLMAVPISVTNQLVIGTPATLFDTHLLNGFNVTIGFRQQYDVSADGQRVLVNAPLEEDTPSPVTVVLNWMSALQKP